MISVVIVDDEPLARERLRTLVAQEQGLQIVAECGDGLSALAAMEEHTPDLLFLDIQMPEMDGFEVLQSLGVAPAAVIFVTAYDQYALRAFDVAAVDYLLKPIDPERFRASVARAHQKLLSPTNTMDSAVVTLLEQLRSQQRYRSRFTVRTADQVSFVRVEDVEWIEATGNYARLFAGGRTYIIRETMKSVEAALDPARFLRIHRSAIVQIDCIASMEPHFHGEWAIIMRNGTRFTSSRSYNDRIRDLMR
jgi:two-component system LytT family response regulator